MCENPSRKKSEGFSVFVSRKRNLSQYCPVTIHIKQQMTMKTVTISKEQRLANRISLAITIIMGAAAIAYIAKAWLISAPHLF